MGDPVLCTDMYNIRVKLPNAVGTNIYLCIAVGMRSYMIALMMRSMSAGVSSLSNHILLDAKKTAYFVFQRHISRAPRQ